MIPNLDDFKFEIDAHDNDARLIMYCPLDECDFSFSMGSDQTFAEIKEAVTIHRFTHLLEDGKVHGGTPS